MNAAYADFAEAMKALEGQLRIPLPYPPSQPPTPVSSLPTKSLSQKPVHIHDMPLMLPCREAMALTSQTATGVLVIHSSLLTVLRGSQKHREPARMSVTQRLGMHLLALSEPSDIDRVLCCPKPQLPHL